jgi:hypothetical protein
LAVAKAQEQITQALLSWQGVSAHAHRFGGIEYRLGQRELGHLHGDHLVDIPFPSRVRDEIVAAGQAGPHHILPESGWVSYYLKQPEDIERATELLRRSYEIALAQRARRKAASEQAQES